jgi:hypothetical protein
MRYLFILLAFCATVSFGSVGSIPISGNSVTPMTQGYYCLPATPTVPVAPFIAPTLVQPTSNPTTTLEMTDGTYYYVITFTTGTGMITSLPSCPVRYSTLQ